MRRLEESIAQRMHGIEPKPFIRGPKQARQMSFHIFNVVQFRCQRVVDVNSDDFPVGLLFVQKSHDSQYFYDLDLPRISHEFPNLADIERIIVTLCFRLRVYGIWILPRRFF
jgi:hypothetical protein